MKRFCNLLKRFFDLTYVARRREVFHSHSSTRFKVLWQLRLLATTMSVSLVANAYLDENSARIRSKPVPWEGYQRAGRVSTEELALIKKVDRQPKAKTESLLLNDGQTYAFLYLKLLKKLTRDDTVSAILVLIGDALAGEQ